MSNEVRLKCGDRTRTILIETTKKENTTEAMRYMMLGRRHNTTTNKCMHI
uniref:Uncharacterized protein n=1 Tax=Arundo donax TaxID=35708 RepID=A0A0A8Y798_ARUDO